MENKRDDFPIFQKRCPYLYFDSAATAHKPQAVIDAISRFYSDSYATVHRAIYAAARSSTDAYQGVREKVHHFIGAAAPEEIIFTRGTTASLNLLARSLAAAFLKPDDLILLTEVEHHSNLVPWQMVAQSVGCKLRFIPVTDRGEIEWEGFEKLLDEGVKIVSLAHVSNVLGTLHPVKAIIEAAHAKGAYVCLDGAQAVAHMPINVQTLDVDFYAFSGHKLYGPTGIGVLYGKRELLEKLPPIEGGGDMVDQVSLQKTTFNILPYKFEAGTPMIAEVIGLGAAIDYLNAIGMEAIASWEERLLQEATEEFLKVPEIQIIGTAKEKGALISFAIDGVHPLDLATLLDCRGVAIRSGNHCSQPTMQRFGCTSLARISFGLYNQMQEVKTFFKILKELLSLLK
jgi:cysteine desulfurase / selenocysteine lyase